MASSVVANTPSSPSMALLKDGDVVFGAMLRKAGIRFEELC